MCDNGQCESHLHETRLNLDERLVGHITEARPPATKQRYYTSLRDIEQRIRQMMTDIAPKIRSAIEGYADPRDASGRINPRNKAAAKKAASDLLKSVFIDPATDSAFTEDGYTARTPFAQLLNDFNARVTAEAVYSHANWMARNLPEDVFQFLARQSFRQLYQQREVDENPFLRRPGESDEEFMERLNDLRIFRPNPFAEYERMHTWVDPNGYQLSQRIWQGDAETRRKLHEMIEKGINEGLSAVDLSKIIESSLLPWAQSRRTSKPYGYNLSYYAMMLARTEIARAANQAAWVSAYMNPYVDRIELARSPNGDIRCPICPTHATIGIGGERLRPAYSVHSAPIPPWHPHCKCHVTPVLTDNPQAVTDRLRAIVQDANQYLLPPGVSPAAHEEFLRTLLNENLFRLVAQWRGQLPIPGFPF